MTKESLEPTPCAVECPKHGIVYLTEEEYELQMSHAYPAWLCPRMESDPPGLCGMDSDFSDENFDSFLPPDLQSR